MPSGFVFAVKGGRFITHLKRLRDVEVPLANFFASGVLALGPTLGPVLWQLPERLAFDEALVGDFLAMLPRTTSAAAELASRHDDKVPDDRALTTAEADAPLRHALEFRHPSFVSDAAYALLRKHDVATVVADSAGRWPRVFEVTSDLVYVRLHGDRELYASGYSAGPSTSGPTGAGTGRQTDATCTSTSTTTRRVTRRTTPSRSRSGSPDGCPPGPPALSAVAVTLSRWADSAAMGTGSRRRSEEERLADDRDRGTGRTDEVRRAYDASPLPMATTAGPGHVYVACNAAYRRHTGADGLVGRAHADTVPGPAGERIARLLDRAWTSHQPSAGGGLYAAPYRDADGDVAGVHLTQVGEPSDDAPDLAHRDRRTPCCRPISRSFPGSTWPAATCWRPTGAPGATGSTRSSAPMAGWPWWSATWSATGSPPRRPWAG